MPAQWEPISVQDVLGLGRQEVKRCPECHGRVKAVKAGPNGVPAAHFEHFNRHKGCSLGDCFDGTRRLHSTPLV